eukprot:UN14647
MDYWFQVLCETLGWKISVVFATTSSWSFCHLRKSFRCQEDKQKIEDD